MTRVVVRLPETLHARFAAIARQEGKSQSELACEALERLFELEAAGKTGDLLFQAHM